MAGSPCSGKTLLARAFPGIPPEMSIEESLDVTRIYSVADQLPICTLLIELRPFHAPHHTISHAGLVGGGNLPKPREIVRRLRPPIGVYIHYTTHKAKGLRCVARLRHPKREYR